MYNAHGTPILKPVFRKKVFQVQHHFWWKISFWKNSTAMPNLALPARKSVTGVNWCKSFNFLSVQWYIKSYNVFFDFFCCIRTWSIYTTPVTFLWMRSPGTRLAGHVARFKIMLQRIFVWSFLKFFMEFTLSSKYLRKCNRFSIMIVNKLYDWCHWRAWTEAMYKARQTFCLDLFLLVA